MNAALFSQNLATSDPRDQPFSKPGIDPMKRSIISTMQTCSRRAGTRALPFLAPAAVGRASEAAPQISSHE